MQQHQRLDLRPRVQRLLLLRSSSLVVLVLFFFVVLVVVSPTAGRWREAREVLGESGEEAVLGDARREGRDLGGRRQDFQERRDLGAGPDGRREERDGRVLDAVVGGDHAQVQRSDVHVVFDGHAARVLEVRDDVFHELRQVVRHVPVRRALQVVEVRVLREAPVEERPRQVVDGVLLVLDGLGHDFRVQVVVQRAVYARLDGQRLVQESPQGLLLRRVAEHRAPRLVLAVPVGLADHLQHLGRRVLDVPVLAPVVPLRAQHHHQVRAIKCHLPARLGRRHEHADETASVERLHSGTVRRGEAAVQKGHALGERLPERRVDDAFESCSVREKVVVSGVHSSLVVVLRGVALLEGGDVDHDVDGGELALLAGRDEDDGLAPTLPQTEGVAVEDLQEDLAHGEEAGGEVGRVEGVEVELEGRGPDVGVEGEAGRAVGAEPVAHVLRVGQ
mmetsp:Transcript_7833/g.24168  ORF Transcript_7833/g.24168 Transcript_7833/m.24168 type:complete len:447 (+) Transcript_7833:883-2223(+)